MLTAIFDWITHYPIGAGLILDVILFLAVTVVERKIDRKGRGTYSPGLDALDYALGGVIFWLSGLLLLPSAARFFLVAPDIGDIVLACVAGWLIVNGIKDVHENMDKALHLEVYPTLRRGLNRIVRFPVWVRGQLCRAFAALRRLKK